MDPTLLVDPTLLAPGHATPLLLSVEMMRAGRMSSVDPGVEFRPLTLAFRDDALETRFVEGSRLGSHLES